MRRSLVWAAGAAMAVILVGGGAEAMPLAPGAVALDGSAITLVRDGCGPFGHRSHYGYCKPNGYGDGGDGIPGYGFGGYGDGSGEYHRRRCFIRETYYGPQRVCRF